MNNFQYQVGGSLAVDAESYVKRKADLQLYNYLLAGDYCYILDSRQVGKSSLLVHTIYRLQQEGYLCAFIDLTAIGGEQITPLQWYKGLMFQIASELGLKDINLLKSWWQKRDHFSYLQRLGHFIEEILVTYFPEQRIFIFIDEIDTILNLDFAVDDFFAFIRSCHEKRSINPAYQRITLAISGVATPSDLIQNKKRTPFNIGRAIRLQNFQPEEVQSLFKGLNDKSIDAKLAMPAILAWTGGQPFLTQKLCYLTISELETRTLDCQEEMTNYVDNLVQKKIIDNWEFQDEPEHLKTISDRIIFNSKYTGRMLGIYQQILQGNFPSRDDSREQVELLLSGLAIDNNGKLSIKNRIYAEVFNLQWVNQQLARLRPYSQTLQAWIASGRTDDSRLLRGKALQDVRLWARGKSLSNEDYQFITASEQQDRQERELKLEAERKQELATRLELEQINNQKLRSLNLRLGMSVVMMSILSLISCYLYFQAVKSEQKAKRQEIQAVISSSKANFRSNQGLNALVDAIRAHSLEQDLRTKAGAELQLQIDFVLGQSIYGAIESNRFVGHNNKAHTVSFSPDGQQLVSAGQEALKFWQRNGKLLKTIDIKDDAIYKVDYSPDGQTIATATGSHNIQLWNPQGNLVKTLSGHQATVWFVTFSADGQTIASASQDGTVKIWQRDGKLIRTLTHDAPVYGVAISPDGQEIAAAATNGAVKIWQRDGRLIRTLTEHQGTAWAVEYSPDGKLLATTDQEGKVRLWQRDGKLLKTLTEHTAAVWGVQFSPNGKFLVSTSVDKTAKVWSRDGTFLRSLKGHEGIVWGIDISPDNSTIATTSWDNTVRLWQQDNPLLQVINTPQDSVTKVALSPDNRELVAVSLNGSIRLWSVPPPDSIAKSKLITTLGHHDTEVWSVAWSPDGTYLASGSADNTVKLWSRDQKLTKTLTGHRDAVYALTISPDSNLIASRSLDGIVRIWQRDGSFIKAIATGQVDSVVNLDFNPQGNSLATVAADGKVQLWNIQGNLIQTWQQETTVRAIKFSPDGKEIAIAETNGTITIRNIDGNTSKSWQLSPENHQNIKAIEFTPDSETLIISSQNLNLKTWKISLLNRQGQILKTLFWHQGEVNFDISSDNKTLVSGSFDKTIGLWNLTEIRPLDKINFACDWAKNYLQNSSEVSPEDKSLCQFN